MLIKPYVPKGKESIKSLPSLGKDSQSNHPAYLGTQDEKNESIENEGRLLMLPIMYHELNVMLNKRIHDTNGKCWKTWPICDCKFARKIRALDIGVSDNGEW